MKIVQVLDYYTGGNGVANCAVMFYKMTVKMGIASAVAARLVDKKESFVKEITYLDELGEEDIIMYHMCIGTPLNQKVCGYACKKVLVYQNITPPSMIERYDPVIAKSCREGLEQLDAMKRSFSVCLVMSGFNKEALIRHGYPKDLITIIPPYFAKEDYEKKPDKETLQKYKDGKVNILFVGRISPNKKHENLIRIFHYYKSHLNPESRLILAGGGEGAYYEQLCEYIKKTGVQDVVFTHQITSAQLMALYRTATVFLCASEHEGYCIPLIEAMYFHIPVIAYDACAVKDTMGGAGILLTDTDPRLAAKVIHAVCTSHGLKQRIILRQTEVVRSLSEEAVFEKYRTWIHNLPVLFAQAAEHTAASRPCNPYDVVMAVKAEDWKMAERNLGYIRKNLRPKKIVIVSSVKIKKHLRPRDGVVFINEDELYEGLSWEKIWRFFSSRQMGASLAGWYLQQFLKLAYAYVCVDEYYLVWDADTIPLQEIPMINPKTDRPYFDMKPEYIRAYFSTIRNLTGMEKVETESFISEHMLFCTRVVRQMLARIEGNPAVPGIRFYEKILHAADYSQTDRSFSEFELYGTFCQYACPKLYEKRHLRTMRCGKMYLGAEPEREALEWAGKKLDTISFEYPQQVIEKSRKLSGSGKFRSRYSVYDLVKRIYIADSLTFSERLRREKEALSMDYPWAKRPAYLCSKDLQLEKSERNRRHTVGAAVFGGSEDAYALSILFACQGMRVVLVDQEFSYGKTKQFRKYFGFQTIFSREYGKNLRIVKKIPEDRKLQRGLQFAFFSSSSFESCLRHAAAFPGMKHAVFFEGQMRDLGREQQKGMEKLALLHLLLLKEDALLCGRKESLVELWEGRTNDGAVRALFSGRIRVNTWENRDDFIDYAGRLYQYTLELESLQKKYKMK